MAQTTLGILLAFAGAAFAGAVAILAKLGYRSIDSSLATALRTIVVLVCACGMVLLSGGQSGLGQINAGNWLFLILSGLATGGSWLCQNRALQLIDASLAAPIDRLSILLTVVFSFLVFGERLSRKGTAGLLLLLAGTLLLLV